MTAINVMVSHTVGFMLTDSLAYDMDTGLVLGHAAKTFTFPHAQSVFAARGFVDPIRWVADLLGSFTSFDDIAQRAPAELAKAWPIIVEKVGLTPMELIVMGWSQSSGRMRVLHSHSAKGFVFKEQPEGAVLAFPLVTERQLAAAGMNSLSDNPGSDLLRIMHAQRATVIAEEPDHAIGGAAVLTMMSSDAIVQRVLHRWPDKIGERVGA
jgi:hypothetical protein